MKFSASLSKLDPRVFTDLQKDILEMQRQSLAIAALEVRNVAVKLVNDNSDGPRQTRYKPKRVVNVSKPGSPPNTDTGRLVQSIKVSKDKDAYLVGTNLLYGAHLEFGTQNMAPRPWLSVALREVTKQMGKITDSVFKKFKGGK